MSGGGEDDRRQKIARQVAELKAKATPDAIRRMQGLLEAELARRGTRQAAAAAKSSVPGKPGAFLAAARRLNASATPPASVPVPGPVPLVPGLDLGLPTPAAAGEDEGTPPGGGARAVLAHWMKIKNEGG
jgi:hypothetical protein